jgi:hypothetical protein
MSFARSKKHADAAQRMFRSLGSSRRQDRGFGAWEKQEVVSEPIRLCRHPGVTPTGRVGSAMSVSL